MRPPTCLRKCGPTRNQFRFYALSIQPNLFGALAEFERDIIKERTNAGLLAARARGRQGGRPKSALSDERKLEIARQMYANRTGSVVDICKTLKIPRATFYRYVRQQEGK